MADDLASLLTAQMPPQGGLSELLRQRWALGNGNPVTPESRDGRVVQGQIRNSPDRPADWAVTSGIAEALSPMVQGYGAGQMASYAKDAFKDADLSTAAGSAVMAGAGMMPMAGKGAKAPVARAVDPLGYYSGALESAQGLKQAKGTPEQMMSQLRAGGAKAGEIEATGLGKFLEGRPSVTRDEIVKHLEGNRLGLNEVQYGTTPEAPQQTTSGGGFYSNMRQRRDAAHAGGFAAEPKWQAHSLDPSNPTYRETVLHLPVKRADSFDEFFAAYRQRFPEAPEAYAREAYEQGATRPPVAGAFSGPSDPTVFRSGHFPEPNIVGHMMTSMTKHEGKPVYTIDQIQSDWGQKLRDGGVRDEAKIAELKADMAKALGEYPDLRTMESRAEKMLTTGIDTPEFRGAPSTYADSLVKWGERRKLIPAGREALALSEQLRRARLLDAEIRTAEAVTTGHPLVNTTDQWTDTTLRRAIQQAIEAKAQGIAVPTGDTVLGYNPGDTAGMQGFYGSQTQRGIVPKNLANLLQKLDPSIQGQYIQQLETPGKGMAGQGFTHFPLSEAAIAKAREGLPLFSMGAAGALTLPAFLQGQEPNQ